MKWKSKMLILGIFFIYILVASDTAELRLHTGKYF